MRNGFQRIWLLALGLTATGCLTDFPWTPGTTSSNARCALQAAEGNAVGDGSFSSGVKTGWQKLTKPFTPGEKPPQPEALDKSLSLNAQSKPTPTVFVAMARLYEQSGNIPEAERQYQLALKDKPQDGAALAGYARLKERMGLPDEAIKLYQQAAKADPRDAGVCNNLALCYARRNMFDEAVASMGRAIALQPNSVLYRNNMATILVDRGKYAEAFAHLRAVHSEAAAYYNMGFLLNRKKKRQEAIEHFAAAVRLDPSMTDARGWLDRLQPNSPEEKSLEMVARRPSSVQQPISASDDPPHDGGLPGWREENRKAAEGPTWPARPAAVVRLPRTMPGFANPPRDAVMPTAPLPPETIWKPTSSPTLQLQ